MNYGNYGILRQDKLNDQYVYHCRIGGKKDDAGNDDDGRIHHEYRTSIRNVQVVIPKTTANLQTWITTHKEKGEKSSKGNTNDNKDDDDDHDDEKNIVMKEKLLEISDKAFQGCIWMTTIDIPTDSTTCGLQRIGNYAFDTCIRLKEITIPTYTLQEIGYGAFQSCTALQTITFVGKFILHDTIKSKSINSKFTDSIFYGCTNLRTINGLSNTSIYHPQKIREIGDLAFADCTNLSFSSTMKLGNLVLSSSSLSSSFSSSSSKFPSQAIDSSLLSSSPSSSDQSYSSLTRIGKWAFQNVEKLMDIVIFPTTWTIDSSIATTTTQRAGDVPFLKEIDEGAFSGCCNLKGIVFLPLSSPPIMSSTVGTGLIRIGSLAFENCTKLCNVILPDTIREIGQGAFRGCAQLQSINIPNSLEMFGGPNVFEGCHVDLKVKIPLEQTSMVPSPKSNDDSEDMENIRFCHTGAYTWNDENTSRCIHFFCIVNRCGRKNFLHRTPDEKRTYPSCLWPLILYRVSFECINEKQRQTEDKEVDEAKASHDFLVQGQNEHQLQYASVLYYLMLYGVSGDLSPHPSR